MRIAFVTPELHRTRGTERGNYEVMVRLARQHKVCLFANHWVPEPGDTDICFHPVPVLRWPGLLRYLSFFYWASLQVWLVGQRHGGFDAIYSPGANCRQVQVSSAWFCQARQLALFRSGKHRPPPHSVMDWLKLGNRWAYAAAVTRVERMFYSSPRLQRVVSPSRLLARDLKAFYGLPEERVRVAYAGVDIEHFTPARRAELRARARQELNLPAERFVFFFIGNNWLIKGLFHLLRALPMVPEAWLVVVGAEHERVESWRHMSEELGVADRIRYVSRRPDILFYYAAADALLAPSVYDTFALMPMEAMACGLPVIVSGNAGVAEILGEGNALVVEDIEDPAQLAGAMRQLVEDPGLRARLTANGVQLARNHSWDEFCGAIEDELLRSAGEHRARSNGNGRKAHGSKLS